MRRRTHDYCYRSVAKADREFGLGKPGPSTVSLSTGPLGEGGPQLSISRTITPSFDREFDRLVGQIRQNAADVRDPLVRTGTWIVLRGLFGHMEVYRDTADATGSRRCGVMAFAAYVKGEGDLASTNVLLSGSAEHMTSGPANGARLGSGTESLYDALRQHDDMRRFIDGGPPPVWFCGTQPHDDDREEVLRNGYACLSYHRDRATFEELEGLARVISVYPASDSGGRLVLGTPLYLERVNNLGARIGLGRSMAIGGLRRLLRL